MSDKAEDVANVLSQKCNGRLLRRFSKQPALFRDSRRAAPQEMTRQAHGAGSAPCNIEEFKPWVMGLKMPLPSFKPKNKNKKLPSGLLGMLLATGAGFDQICPQQCLSPQ